MERPKIVFIDWFGTLSNSRFWGHLENTSKEGSHLYKLIEKSLFTTHKSLINPWMRGDYTSEEIIDKISLDVKVDFQKIKNQFIKSCKSMKFVSPDIPNVINQLRKNKIKVYIATDNMDSFDRWTEPSMKLNQIFDGILNSYNLSVLKADFDKEQKSLFFEDTLNKEKVRPEETILIDDREDKTNMISNYGIHYLRINEVNTLEKTLKKIISKL